jgi:hypothetical protein
MEKQLAQEILAFAEAATESLNKGLVLAKEKCSESDFNQIRSAVANILVAIQADLLKSVYARYPDLDKFGYRRSQSRDQATSLLPPPRRSAPPLLWQEGIRTR